MTRRYRSLKLKMIKKPLLIKEPTVQPSRVGCRKKLEWEPTRESRVFRNARENITVNDRQDNRRLPLAVC